MLRASLAQLAEQGTFNPKVQGSSPWGGTNAFTTERKTMLVYVLTVLAFIVILSLFIKDSKNRKEDLGPSFAFSLLIAGVVFLCLMFISLMISSFTRGEKELSNTFHVRASADGSSISGQMGIFSGYIEEKQYYFYYYETSDGFIKQSKLPANRTKLKEVDTDRAYIEVYSDTKDWDQFWYIYNADGYNDYILYVPKGSVIETNIFDLQD